MFHGKNKEVNPFYVKSDWNPPVQPSVALESFLEEVKSQLAKIKISKPKNNLSRKEHEALTELNLNAPKYFVQQQVRTLPSCLYKRRKA